MPVPLRITSTIIEDAVAALRRTALGECAFLLVVVVGLVQALRCAGGALLWPEPTDFAAFVHNARTWLADQPYATVRDPNAPHVIALFSPFVALPLRSAMAIWLTLSTAAACASVWIVRSATTFKASGPLTLLLVSLFLASPPVGDMLVDGNMTWALWLPFTVAWAQARQGRTTRAAVIIGVLMTAKPFLALWLVYFAIRGMWVALGSAIAAGLVTCALGVLITGPAAWFAWIDALGRIDWFAGENNASVAGVVARTAGVVAWLWTACSLAIAVAHAAGTSRRAPNVDRDWTATLLASLLIAPLGWRYYFCWAIGPLTGYLRASAPTPAFTILLLLWFFTPALGSSEWSAVARATLGSAVFWTTLTLWVALLWTATTRNTASER